MAKKAAKQEKIGQILQKKMNMRSFLPANHVLSPGIAQDIDGSLSKDYLTKAAIKLNHLKSKRRPNGGGLDAMLPKNGSTMVREGARAGESTTKSKSTAMTRRDFQTSPRGIDTETCSLAAPSLHTHLYTELANYDEQLFSRNQ